MSPPRITRRHLRARRLREPTRARQPAPAPSASPPRSKSRAGGVLGTLFLCAFLAVWVTQLRPQFLGGPAGYVTVAGASMEPRLHTGDVVVVHRREQYRRGDVVAYRIPRDRPGAGRLVIHRIVGGSAREGYILRGDNRTSNDAWRPRPADVVGAEAARVPGLGRLARSLLTPVGLGAVVGLTVMCMMLAGPAGSVSRRDPA